MSQEETKEVTVHKANVALIQGESLSAFSMAIRDASQAAMRKSFTLSDKDYVYVIEIFGDSVVLELYRSGTGKTLYLMMPYERKAGVFNFGKASEVRRVTTFLPAVDSSTLGNQVEVKKALESIEKASREAWRPFWEGALN